MKRHVVVKNLDGFGQYPARAKVRPNDRRQKVVDVEAEPWDNFAQLWEEAKSKWETETF